MNEYRDVFADEAAECLQSMNDQLLHLEQEPDNDEAMAEIFRCAHNLKGMSGTMGYNPMVVLTHAMENVLDRLRTGDLTAGPGVVNLLFECLDSLETMLSSLDSIDEFSASSKELMARLEGLTDESPRAQPTQGGSEPNGSFREGSKWLDESERHTFVTLLSGGENIWNINVRLDPDCVMKSVRAYMVLKAVQKHGQIVKSIPAADDLEDVTATQDLEDEIGQEIVLYITGDEPSQLITDLQSITEVEEVEYEAITEELVREASQDAEKPRKEAARGSSRKAERSVRVETEKLDSLINLVGELVISRTRVMSLTRQNDRDDLSHALQQLNRIITDVQDATMKLRMVSIKHVFDRFPRMVRDLSKSKGKDVSLHVSGEDTELDRTIVNQLSDPLVHLLRNAVDHGLEDPQHRKPKGKTPEGNIWLGAQHEGSHVVISVADDGRGIDPHLLRSKAVEKGVLSQAEAQSISDRDILDLVFERSFSTAGQITDVSGRGVGMDAVRTAAADLNGTVEIESQVGHGTRVSLRLPLTLAIIRALLVRAGQIYAIPVETIRENLYVHRKDIRTVNQQEVIVRREEVIPLVSLSQSLHMASAGDEEKSQVSPAVVVGTDDSKMALVVEELLGQQEIVVKSLTSSARSTPAVAGATVLGDGKVVLIVDTNYLLSRQERKRERGVPVV